MYDLIVYTKEKEIQDSFLSSFTPNFNLFLTDNISGLIRNLNKNTANIVLIDQNILIESGFDAITGLCAKHSEKVFIILCEVCNAQIIELIKKKVLYSCILNSATPEEIRIEIDHVHEKIELKKTLNRQEKELKEYSLQLTHIKEKLENENFYLKEEIKLNKNFESIICEDPKFRNILGQIEEIAVSDASILIMGETGTGKELIARAIHNLSRRNKNPFVKINCASIPDTLLETELFGHEKGAFTGAFYQKKGKFELADNGTIFLDEIGELPIQLQPKLLRVLQEGEFERIGGTKPLKINTRVISATNKNLLDGTGNGDFRKDLYYRLCVFPVIIPPLRERRKDIPPLIEYFVDKFNKKNGKKIKVVSKELYNYLLNYDFPGNVRELENMIEIAVILEKSQTLQIPYSISDKNLNTLQGNNIQMKLETIEKNHILKVLEYTSWKISGKNGAAEILGINRTTLNSKLKKLNISRKN